MNCTFTRKAYRTDPATVGEAVGTAGSDRENLTGYRVARALPLRSR
jgi:hypothetical protein